MSNESQWKDSENSVNIQKIVGAAIAHLPWFIGSIIVTFIIAFLYLRYSTPVYQITAEILIKDEKSSEGITNEALLEELGVQSGIKNINNEMRTLNSKKLVSSVVRDLHLNVHYSSPGRVTTTELFETRPFTFIVPEDIIDSFTGKRVYKLDAKGETGYTLTEIKDKKKKGEWQGKWGDTLNITALGPVVLERTNYPLGHNVEYTIYITSIEKATNKYAKSIVVTIPNKQSSILQLTLKDELPKRGEIVLNKLIEEYQLQNIQEKNLVAENTIKFIVDRLDSVTKELNGVEGQMENYKKANKVADLTKEATSLMQNVSVYDGELAKEQIQLGVLNALEEDIKKNKNDKKLIPASLATQVALFSNIITKYNELLQRRADLLLSSTENNPMVVSIDKQLDALQQDIQVSLASAKREVKARIQVLESKAGYYSAEVQKIPTKEREYVQFVRQQEIKQSIYLFLLKKREETAIGKATTIPNSKLIEAAKASGSPYVPVRSTIFLSAFLIGLLVPATIIYLKNLLNTRIKGRADIASVSSLAIAGEVGHNDGEGTLTVVPGSRSVIAEQFRALRTNVEFLLGGSHEKVIMITSSMSGEGKSFISLNLSSTLALSGKKVVLMELDLRKPKISKYLGIDNVIGFSNYAIGQASYEQILIPSGVQENFYIIPSGPVPPNPSELIVMDTVVKLFAKLREDFDYVVIDTAPIGFVTDAQLLNRYSDTALYVVRQNFTYKQQIQFAEELQTSKKIPKLNLVVNDVKVSRGYGYGYGYGYYSYGYGYGYGSYGSYFEKSKNKNNNFLEDIWDWIKNRGKKD